MIQPSQQRDAATQPAEAFFPCRWFYTIYGKEQPRDLTVCQTCPHWFPRPPRDLIPGYWPETQKMLGIVSGEVNITPPPTGFSPEVRRQPDKSWPWWQRLREKFHL